MTDVALKPAPTKEQSDFERASRAVRHFHRIQPNLEAFARVFTKNKHMAILPTGGTSMTDGKVIYLRVNIEMGDEHRHQREVCNRRDAREQLLCQACLVRENILVSLFHEIAHVAYDSFEAMSNDDKEAAVEEAVAEAERFGLRGRRLEAIRQSMEEKPPATYGEASARISPYLQPLTNGLEDARINVLTMDARKGMKSMFQARAQRIFEEGIETPDGSRIHWRDQPENAQVTVALSQYAQGFYDESWFSDPVAEAMRDEELRSLAMQCVTSRSAADIYTLSFPILERLRKLGFCKAEGEPEDDPEPEDEPGEPGDPDDEDTGGDSDDTGDESDDQGDSVEADTDPGDEADDDSDEGSDHQDADPGEEEAMPQEGDDEADGAPQEGDDDGDEADSDDEQGTGASGDGEGDTDVEDDPDGDEQEGTEEAGDDPDDEEPEGSGSGSDDGEAEDGPDELGGDDDGLGGIENDLDPFGDEDDEDDPLSGTEADDEDPWHDDEEGDEEGDAGSEGEGDGSSGESNVDDDGEEADLGTPDDIDAAMSVLCSHKEFHSHDDEEEGDEGDDEPKPEPDEDEQEVERAIVQERDFDEPSMNVMETKVYESGKAMRPDMVSRNPDKYGVKPMPERVLQQSLGQMRVAFSENRKGTQQRNLRSGKINAKVLGRRVATGDDRVFQKRKQPGKRDYFVVIGIDVSFSTSSGLRIQNIKSAAMAQAELLSRLGVPFEVWAHTCDVNGRANDKAMYGEWLETQVFRIKDANEPWSTAPKRRLESLVPVAANLDGHTMEFYRKRLDRSSATDKLIMYYTDGDMPLENYNEELRILKRELKECERRGYIVTGVAFETDSPTKHGLPTVRIDSIDDVPKVVEELRKRLA